MKKLLCGLLETFTGASCRQPEPPQQKQPTAYEAGRYGTPEQAVKHQYEEKAQAGARDAVHDGNPANFAAMMQASSYQHQRREMVSGVHSDRYGLDLESTRPWNGLTVDEWKTVLGTMPPDKAKQINQEMFESVAGSPRFYDARLLSYTIAAGADVDAKDGYALRSAADNGQSNHVESLYKAGASFEKALFGAQVGTNRSGPEVVRKLALYNNKLRAGEPGFEPMQVPAMEVVLKAEEKVKVKLPRRPLPTLPIVI